MPFKMRTVQEEMPCTSGDYGDTPLSGNVSAVMPASDLPT